MSMTINHDFDDNTTGSLMCGAFAQLVHEMDDRQLAVYLHAAEAFNAGRDPDQSASHMGYLLLRLVLHIGSKHHDGGGCIEDAISVAVANDPALAPVLSKGIEDGLASRRGSTS